MEQTFYGLFPLFSAMYYVITKDLSTTNANEFIVQCVNRDLKQLVRGRRRERPEVIFHLFFGVRMSEISFSCLWRCRGRQVSVFFVVVRT